MNRNSSRVTPNVICKYGDTYKWAEDLKEFLDTSDEDERMDCVAWVIQLTRGSLLTEL